MEVGPGRKPRYEGIHIQTLSLEIGGNPDCGSLYYIPSALHKKPTIIFCYGVITHRAADARNVI